MLGQHGAGSSALQAVAACLSIRFCEIPPTINHVEPDPEAPPLRIVTRAESVAPDRVLVHSIGFGGFYYSAAAFEHPGDADAEAEDVTTGKSSVVWSARGHPRFRPTEEFTRPLEPMRPAVERPSR